MKSKNLFFILLIFFISLVQSATLSISPPQIDFVGTTGEKICQNITISANGSNELIGETKWAMEGIKERKLSLHNLTEKQLGLEINFPEEILIVEKDDVKICLEGKNKGNFHGILLYRIKNKPIQIGIWINASITGNDFVKITGNIINVENKERNLLFLPSILLIALLVLIFLYKKRN